MPARQLPAHRALNLQEPEPDLEPDPSGVEAPQRCGVRLQLGDRGSAARAAEITQRDLERDLEPDPSGVQAQLQSAEAENATLRRELSTLRREKLEGERAARQREQQASAQLGAMGDKLEALATMALALGANVKTVVPVAASDVPAPRGVTASDVPRGVLAAATTPDSGQGGTDSGQGGQGGTGGSEGDSEGSTNEQRLEQALWQEWDPNLRRCADADVGSAHLMRSMPLASPEPQVRHTSTPAVQRVNTKGYPSTYLATGLANVRAGTQ